MITALPLRAFARKGEEPLSDEAVAAAALEGDVSAWDHLVRRHDKRVLLALLARGVRIDRARDICQETWARLIDQQRAGKLPQLSLPGLAIRQALFLASDEARRGKRAHVGLEDALVSLVSDGDEVHEQVCTRSELSRARALLAQCHPTAQEVFTLLYGERGLSPAEVAEKLGLSTQRVRQIVCEVRKKLRAELAPEES